nr:odorant receptor SameORX [Schistocerca americana]
MTQCETEQRRGQSVLRPNIRLLCALGLWQPAGSALFHAYTAAVLAVGVAHLAVASVGLWLRPGGLAEVTLGLANLFVILTALTKSALLLSRRPLFYALVRRVDQLAAEQQVFCDRDSSLLQLSSRSQARATRLTLFLHWYVLFALLSWAVIPLLAPSGERLWPFQQLPLEPWGRSPLYECSYALQCVGTAYFSLINMDTDCFFMAVMAHVSVQFRILASRFAGLNAVEATVAESKPSTAREVSSQIRLGHDVLHRQLRACVETHQKLLSLVSYLNIVMSPMAMMQLAVGAINTCMVLFPATYSEDDAAVMKCWGALPLIATQVFLYCSGAQHLMDQAEAVSTAAYSCGWPESSCQLRRSLLLVICRAQRPLALTAGRMFLINRATFLSLLQATYSYYTLLQHFNSH